jgi:outer membrane protein OmpA-like peptidoglycan-associated protein
MKKTVVVFMALMVVAFSAAWLVGQEDEAGCKDHPMFTRMKNFYITSCESNFDAVEFSIEEEKTQTVEGQKTVIAYRLNDEAAAPSQLQIRRNYQNAVKQLGGALVYESDAYASFKITKNGKEIWLKVEIYNSGAVYNLTVLEKGEMTQEVTANEMLEALNKDGFMALYINFDTGKSDIKPESRPIIDQVVALLKANPGLKLSIEGHTDNVGTPQENKTLSEQRARSMMNAIVSQGIAAARLSAVGWGQDRPIADNRSEEGRAKNRRVEIVKK